jgi:hypothetical protein
MKLARARYGTKRALGDALDGFSIANSKRSEPSIEKARAIAAALDVPVDLIYYGVWNVYVDPTTVDDLLRFDRLDARAGYRRWAFQQRGLDVRTVDRNPRAFSPEVA